MNFNELILELPALGIKIKQLQALQIKIQNSDPSKQLNDCKLIQVQVDKAKTALATYQNQLTTAKKNYQTQFDNKTRMEELLNDELKTISKIFISSKIHS